MLTPQYNAIQSNAYALRHYSNSSRFAGSDKIQFSMKLKRLPVEYGPSQFTDWKEMHIHCTLSEHLPFQRSAYYSEQANTFRLSVIPFGTPSTLIQEKQLASQPLWQSVWTSLKQRFPFLPMTAEEQVYQVQTQLNQVDNIKTRFTNKRLLAQGKLDYLLKVSENLATINKYKTGITLTLPESAVIEYFDQEQLQVFRADDLARQIQLQRSILNALEARSSEFEDCFQQAESLLNQKRERLTQLQATKELAGMMTGLASSSELLKVDDLPFLQAERDAQLALHTALIQLTKFDRLK